MWRKKVCFVVNPDLSITRQVKLRRPNDLPLSRAAEGGVGCSGGLGGIMLFSELWLYAEPSIARLHPQS
jgi:hypothetical protein